MGMTLKILIFTLFFNAVEARPISYSGGHTIMHFNDNMKESHYYHYSPSYKYSFGIETLNKLGLAPSLVNLPLNFETSKAILLL